jgi:hypothetical protein
MVVEKVFYVFSTNFDACSADASDAYDFNKQ